MLAGGYQCVTNLQASYDLGLSRELDGTKILLIMPRNPAPSFHTMFDSGSEQTHDAH